MGITALVTWLLTAAGGFYLLATWIAKGGLRAPRNSHLPPAVVFAHFALAAVGLVVWIVYLVTSTAALAWTGFVLLAPVALLGFVLLARWLPTYRARASVPSGGGPGTAASSNGVPAERHFPVGAVVGHGLFAVVTVVLALLTVLRMGGH
jgi:manganese efflux pump family protein